MCLCVSCVCRVCVCVCVCVCVLCLYCVRIVCIVCMYVCMYMCVLCVYERDRDVCVLYVWMCVSLCVFLISNLLSLTNLILLPVNSRDSSPASNPPNASSPLQGARGVYAIGSAPSPPTIAMTTVSPTAVNTSMTPWQHPDNPWNLLTTLWQHPDNNLTTTWQHLDDPPNVLKGRCN